MRFLELEVQAFKGIEKSRVTFRSGLNLLIGPNEAGKSTLAEAVRAVLLCKATSTATDEFFSKNAPGSPRVVLTYEADDGKTFRIDKTFGPKGSATLSWTRDGSTFSRDANDQAADTKLREHLAWGLRPPGGRGGARGMESTFLTRVLLAGQTEVECLFDEGLTESSEEERKRIQGALAAAAEDPRYKRALARANEHYGRYFSSTGRRRSGQNSPWKAAQTALNEAQGDVEGLQGEADRVESLRTDLAERQRQLREAIGRRDETKTALETMEKRRAAFEARRALQGVRDAAHETWAKARQVEAERDRLAQALESAEAELQRAKERVDAAAAASTQAEAARQNAADEVRAVEQSNEGAQRRLKEARLDAEIRALEQETAALLERCEEAHALEQQQEDLQKLECDFKEKQARHAERQRESAEATKKKAALADERAAARRRAAREREAEAATRLTRAQAALSTAEEALSRKGELEREIEGVEAIIARGQGLDRAQVERARALRAALDEARAKASAGLSLTVKRYAPVSLRVRQDGSEGPSAMASTEQLEVDAERALVVDIGDVATVSVEAGTATLRAELAAAEGRWGEEGAPLLVRYGVDSVDGLADLQSATDSASSTLQRLRAELETTAARAEERPRAEAELAGADAALAESKAELARWADAPPMTSTRSLDTIEAELEAQDAKANAASQAAATLLGELGQLETRVEQRRQSVAEGEEALGATPEEVTKAAATRHPELVTSLDAARARRRDVSADAEVRLKAARDTLDAAEATVAANKTALEDAEGQRTEQANQRATLSGQLQEVERQLAQLDLPRRKAALDAAEAALAAAPEVAFSEEALQERQAALEAADREVRETEDQVSKAVGALGQTNGFVAQERLEDAVGRLEEKKAAQLDVQLEAEAAKLLVDKLQEAEAATSRHIGVLLGPLVGRRFSELTTQRYQDVKLDKSLMAKTVHLGSTALAPGELSVGTRHQLATLLRVILAEQLGHPVLLDDQLVQSDAARMRWFGENLLETAEKTQVIVLSCRGEDYLAAAESRRDAVHVIDVGEAVQRAPSVAEPA